MASKEQVEKLRQISKECTKTPIEELLSGSAWKEAGEPIEIRGTIHPRESCMTDSEIALSLKTAFRIFKDFLHLPVEVLPNEAISSIIKDAESLQKIINFIKTSPKEPDNPPDGIFPEMYDATNRQITVENLGKQIDSIYMHAHSYIPYLSYLKDGPQKNGDFPDGAKDYVPRYFSKTLQDLKNKEKEFYSIVAVAREKAASVGVAHFSNSFQKMPLVYPPPP